MKQNIKFSYINVKTSYEMHLNESKTFFEYLSGMRNFYKPIDECKTKNINVRLAPKVTELLISGIKTNIALVFNTQHV